MASQAEGTRTDPLRLLGLTLVLGLLAGGLLAQATLALSLTDIGGPGWSLRGNGALIVEFAGGPALLAGGWVALSRRRAGQTVLAGLLTLAIELAVGFGPILLRLGPDTRLLIGVYLPILALVAGLALAPPRTAASTLAPSLACLLTVMLGLSLPFLTFFVVPLLLPLVLALPSLVRDARREVVPSLVVLPAALVAGLVLGQRLSTWPGQE